MFRYRNKYNPYGVLRRDIGGGAPSPLLTDLVEVWEMNELSGNRIGAHAGLILTDNNTVGSAAGILGNAAQFVAANSEYLSIPDDSLPELSGNLTFAAWVKPNSGARGIFSQFRTGDNQRAVQCFTQSGATTQVNFGVSGDGLNTTTVATPVGTLTAGNWHLIVCWHDATANTINIQVNDGAVYSAAHSTGIYNTVAPFQIGTGITNGLHWDGLIDQFCIWKRVLTASERSTYWNSGAGMVYPF